MSQQRLWAFVLRVRYCDLIVCMKQILQNEVIMLSDVDTKSVDMGEG